MKTFCTIAAILGLVSVKTVSGWSWQSYVDDQLVGTGHIEKGMIIGLDGGIWAATPGFSLKAGEGKRIVELFKIPSAVFANGVTVNSVKYLGIKQDDRSIYGKQYGAGVVLVKTLQTVIIGVYNGQQQPGNAARVVEKLGDYLIEAGY